VCGWPIGFQHGRINRHGRFRVASGTRASRTDSIAAGQADAVNKRCENSFRRCTTAVAGWGGGGFVSAIKRTRSSTVLARSSAEEENIALRAKRMKSSDAAKARVCGAQAHGGNLYDVSVTWFCYSIDCFLDTCVYGWSTACGTVSRARRCEGKNWPWPARCQLLKDNKLQRRKFSVCSAVARGL
jgi:hypothetical protein